MRFKPAVSVPLALGALLTGACSTPAEPDSAATSGAPTSAPPTTASTGSGEQGPPPPSAAVRIELSGGACLTVGTSAFPRDNSVILWLQDNVTNLDSFPRAVNGEGGSLIACSVTEVSSGDLSVSVEVTGAAQYFAIQGTIDGTSGSNATATWYDKTRQTASLASSSCTLTLLQAATGSALVGFACMDMVSSQQPTAVCVAKGTFIVQHCVD